MATANSVEVIVFGSAIVDFICYCPRLPKVGETLHGDRFATGFGGKGANQCVAAARLGARTAMIANLGADQWGQNYLDNLRKQGVNTDLVRLIDGETTGIAQITVSNAGDNQIVIVTGANKTLSIASYRSGLNAFIDAKILICQLETPVHETIEALKLFKGTSILNAAPALETTPIELIQYPSILCVNETEASLMTGIPVESLKDAKHAVDRLIEMGAKIVILTMGEQGAVYSDKRYRSVKHVPCQKVEKVVDTTGAGDAFIGALAFFMAKYPKKSMSDCIGAACEIASLSVQKPGTQASFPYVDVVEKMQLDSKSYLCVEL